MKLTMTLPDRIGAALTAAGAEMDLEASEYLKSMLFAAAHSPQGVTLRLELPPLPKGDVPLLTQAGVTVEEARS